jgi:hypothetical protein
MCAQLPQFDVDTWVRVLLAVNAVPGFAYERIGAKYFTGPCMHHLVQLTARQIDACTTCEHIGTQHTVNLTRSVTVDDVLKVIFLVFSDNDLSISGLNELGHRLQDL